MTSILIDRNCSASPDPHDGSRRRVAIEAVGTQRARIPGVVGNKR